MCIAYGRREQRNTKPAAEKLVIFSRCDFFLHKIMDSAENRGALATKEY